LVVLLVAVGFTAVGGGPTREDQLKVILLIGAAGQPQYSTNFAAQAEVWTAACGKAGACVVAIGTEPASNGLASDRERLQQFLEAEPKAGSGQLWLVLIGHGTFDGQEAKLNLRGPDLTANELSSWLKPFQRPLVIINTASASAPFLNAVSSTNRVIITATRSGYEHYFTRFGGFFAESITTLHSDLDKDGQVSLLEAFLTAARRAAEFYKVEGRISTEHALLEDNGDGKGTPAEWFQGLRPVKKPEGKSVPDGLLARQLCLVISEADQHLSVDQRKQRDDLERAILLHREKKEQLSEVEYYRELEELLLQMAKVTVGGN
jgi:hypothetical protein